MHANRPMAIVERTIPSPGCDMAARTRVRAWRMAETDRTGVLVGLRFRFGIWSRHLRIADDDDARIALITERIVCSSHVT